MRTTRSVGLPSSSMLLLPQAFGIVPSSTAFTIGEAICVPSFSEKTESFLETDVASSECPQASWKITPPFPGPITTVIFPLGQSAAFSIVSADFAADFASETMSIWFLKNSNPDIVPGPSNPVSNLFPSDAIATNESRPRSL